MRKGKKKYTGYVIQTNGNIDSFEIYADGLQTSSNAFMFYKYEDGVNHFLGFYPINRTVIKEISEVK